MTVLGSASRYLFQSILLVPEADLSAPTPCSDWNLGTLLLHVQASLEHFTDVLMACEAPGAASPESETDPGTDSVATIRARIVDLLVAWTSAPAANRWCEVGDRILPAEIVVCTAAIEMVLHAWDISQACKADRPIPAELASDLLDVSPPLAAAGAANQAFTGPLDVSITATPGERLLALFGRRGLIAGTAE